MSTVGSLLDTERELDLAPENEVRRDLIAILREAGYTATDVTFRDVYKEGDRTRYVAIKAERNLRVSQPGLRGTGRA